MARQNSFEQRFELFLAAAAIAAHANAAGQSFRQRDLKFLVDLLSNWVEHTFTERKLFVQNTQVQRFLDTLVQEGFAQKLLRQSRPSYRLTRLGLLEMLARLSARPIERRSEHFFFVHFFLKNYGPRIAELIRAEGKQFPPHLRSEIDALLDTRRLVTEEITFTDRELRRLQTRINEGKEAARRIKLALQAGRDLSPVISELEKELPYELNSQKPLSELMNSIPPDLAIWELSEGNHLRAVELWGPIVELMKSYRSILLKLANSNTEGSSA